MYVVMLVRAAVLNQCPVLKMRVFRGCWNLEVVGISTSIPNDSLEPNVFKIFDKLGVYVHVKDIQVCHDLKDNERVNLKFSNRKDNLQILCVKKDLKSLDPTESDFPEGTRIFINRSLCAYYRGL